MTIANESIESRIAERQLALKSAKSKSWFVEVNKLLSKYGLPSAHDLLAKLPSKHLWKVLVHKAVHNFWNEKLRTEAEQKVSLKYLNIDNCKIGNLHIKSGIQYIHINRMSQGPQLRPNCWLDATLYKLTRLNSTRTPLIQPAYSAKKSQKHVSTLLLDAAGPIKWDNRSLHAWKRVLRSYIQVHGISFHQHLTSSHNSSWILHTSMHFPTCMYHVSL